MARKRKPESSSGGNAPWLNTFADLMNLLLCFFVMLFAYSDLSEEKFEALSMSMANSIGILEAGGSSVGQEQLISSGMSQLNNLSKMFDSVGKRVYGTRDPEASLKAGDNFKNEGSKDNVLTGNEGVKGDKITEGNAPGSEGSSAGGKTDNQDKEIGLEEAIERLREEKMKETSEMYDQISDYRELYNLTADTELKMDPQYQFVQLELKGSVLYDSGSADIRKEAEPILKKIGKLLKRFEGYEIEIVGHTDNVPMVSGAFKDNNWLSTARALNAAQFLIDNCDLDPAGLKYSGRGEYEPVSSNATSEGRAKNRRIEIKIYNKYSSR